MLSIKNSMLDVKSNSNQRQQRVKSVKQSGTDISRKPIRIAFHAQTESKPYITRKSIVARKTQRNPRNVLKNKMLGLQSRK